MSPYADPVSRAEARRKSERKGCKPWRPGGPGHPPKGVKVESKQERKRKGLCVNCGGKPKAGRLRCEACLKRQCEWDKAYRDKQKGAATVEPQCKLPDGKMRADHVFDEDGLCDCSARRMEFAPPPELVETPVARKPRTGLDDGPSLPRARPGRGAAHRPSSAHRAAFTGARSFAEPRAAPKPRAKRRTAEPEKRIGDTTFRALVAQLEERRDQMTATIAALRDVEKWWPGRET